MADLLLVEDDQDIGDPLARVLRRNGHTVELTRDGAGALAAAPGKDLIVLDLGLPDIDGLEVCRRIRASGDTVPILILTARSQEVDLVAGLDGGADDYLTKPFRVSELAARVRALLRRTLPEDPVTRIDDIVVDHDRREVTVAGRAISLTPKEYELLHLLLQRAGRVVERQLIMREVWQTQWVGNTKTLDMHLSALRRKLGPAGDRINTVRGVGLQYEPVSGRVDTAADDAR